MLIPSQAKIFKKHVAVWCMYIFVCAQVFSLVPSAQAVTINTLSTSFYADKAIAVATGSDNFARIAFFDDLGPLKYAICNDASCSSPTFVTIDPSAGGSADNHLTLKLDSNNIPYIAYQNQSSEHLKFATCSNASCSSPTLTTIDTSSAGWDVSMDLGSDNYPRIVHRKRFNPFPNNTLDLVRCTNSSCTTRVITTVDAISGSADTGSSIALTSSNYPTITYLKSNKLKYLTCTDIDCSSPTITEVDGSNAAGYYSSLALSSTGLGRIVYRDAANSDLKYAECLDSTCSSTNITVLDSDGGFYAYKSTLILDSSEYPKIAYFSDSTNGLRYISCSNSSCTGASPVELASMDSLVGMSLSSSDTPYIAFRDLADWRLSYIQCANATCTDVISSSGSVSSQILSGNNVEYTITVDPGTPLPNGGQVKLSFPATYSTSFASLTDGDVSVSGTNITSTSEAISTSQNTITSTITASASVSDPITFTIGDGAPGGLNDLSNPATPGLFSIGVNTYDSSNTLLEQSIALVEITNNVSVQANITEALILNLGNTSISLTASPSVNNGEDKSQYTVLTTATNALNGYALYGKLDDGTGNARLTNGSNYITAGTGENSLGYEATNSSYSSGESVNADAAFSNISTILNSNSENIGLPSATNSQQHTVYYDLNVDFTTPAGSYTGTITYTAVGSF